MDGFALVPLPSNLSLWNAKTTEQWMIEYGLCSKERTIYGLSDKGKLRILQQDEAGVQTSMADWDEWIAAVGEIGTLVMIAASLL